MSEVWRPYRLDMGNSAMAWYVLRDSGMRKHTTQRELKEAGRKSRERMSQLTRAPAKEFWEVTVRLHDDASAITASDVRFIIKEALRNLGYVEIVSVTKDSFC